MSDIDQIIRFICMAIDQYCENKDSYSLKRIIRYILENKNILDKYLT